MAIFSVTKFSVSYWIYLQPVIAKEGLDSYSCVVQSWLASIIVTGLQLFQGDDQYMYRMHQQQQQ
jgi:hypothetical protein